MITRRKLVVVVGIYIYWIFGFLNLIKIIFVGIIMKLLKKKKKRWRKTLLFDFESLQRNGEKCFGAQNKGNYY